MQRKLWKKVIVIFTCLGLIGTGILSYQYLDKKTYTPTKVEDWNSYTSRDQRFGIQFPSDPKESEEELDIANTKINFHQLSSEEKEAVYAVSYVDFPGHWKWLGTQKLLNKSFTMFVQNENGVEEILQQEITTHQGHTALAYRLKQEGKEVFGKFVVAGNTLYRVTVSYPTVLADKIQTDAFLDSFQVRS